MAEWRDFVERKLGTALMLANGECNGSYSDACVLLSALISGIAAELWPGEGIDRVRFIQLWVDHCDPALSPTRVSVPLLRAELRSANRSDDVRALDEARPKMFGLGHGTRVLRGVDVDLPESEVKTVAQSLSSAQIRRFSYPAVFYRHVRSNLTHEYKVSDSASSHFATRLQADVSYVNRHDPQEPELSRRLIHFHVDWLVETVRSISNNVTKLIEGYQTLPIPQRWWING